MILRRFPVGAGGLGDGERARLEELAARPPAGDLHLISGLGFALRREADVFSAVAFGMSTGLGMLAAVLSARGEPGSVVLPGLAGLMFVASLMLAARVVLSRVTRLHVRADRGRLCVSRTVFGRARRLLEVPTDDIVTVEVRKTEEEHVIVSLRGPRHERLGEILRLGLLDPESLGPYVAELTALVARGPAATR